MKFSSKLAKLITSLSHRQDSIWKCMREIRCDSHNCVQTTVDEEPGIRGRYESHENDIGHSFDAIRNV